MVYNVHSVLCLSLYVLHCYSVLNVVKFVVLNLDSIVKRQLTTMIWLRVCMVKKL